MQSEWSLIYLSLIFSLLAINISIHQITNEKHKNEPIIYRLKEEPIRVCRTCVTITKDEFDQYQVNLFESYITPKILKRNP